MSSNGKSSKAVEESRWYYRDEAAEYLGVSEATLRQWACSGRHKIPYYKTGRRVRYLREDLDEFLEQRRRTHASQPV